MIKFKNLGVAAAAAVATLTLAACSGGSVITPSSPSPSPTATAAASPAPSPSPSRTATWVDPYPNIEDLVLTTSGLGPLALGVDIATNPGAAMVQFVANACYSEEMGITEGRLDRWEDNYPGSPFHVDGNDMGLDRIDVVAPEITTDTGIHIGSTLAELQAAYPTLEAGVGGITSAVWWFKDEHGFLVFETQNSSMEPGLNPDDPVILMRALDIIWDGYHDWGAANSGNVAGACF